MGTLIMDAPHNARKLAMLERERKESEDARQAVWVFLWTLFVFKIVTIAVIWYIAGNTREVQALAFTTTWIWFIIPAAAIGGPVMVRLRMRRLRKRRTQLQQAEWNVPEPPPRVTVIEGPGDMWPEPRR
jgi:hypothetical protein